MSLAVYEIRREARDWVAVQMHSWERTHGRLGWRGWTFSVLAWLLAGYALLSAVSLSGMWLYSLARQLNPPLTLPETAAVVLAEMGLAALLIYLTTPWARRRAAYRHAWHHIRRMIKSDRLSPGQVIRIILDDAGWTETDSVKGIQVLAMPWRDVRYLDMNDEYLFVGTTENNWTVVPARSMIREGTFGDLAAEVRDRASAVRPA